MEYLIGFLLISTFVLATGAGISMGENKKKAAVVFVVFGLLISLCNIFASLPYIFEGALFQNGRGLHIYSYVIAVAPIFFIGFLFFMWVAYQPKQNQ